MQKTVSKAQGLALLVFVNVMWGLSFIFSKTALAEGMPAMTLAFCRYVMTAAIMLPLCLKREGSVRLGPWKKMGFISTMLGVTVYYFFEYTGLMRTTASAASLILALVPMMTLAWRVLFDRERVGAVRLCCVLLSLIGAYLVIRGDGSEGGGTLLGNLLMVAACLCWTGYILSTPPMMAACSSLRVTTWQALCAVVTLAPLALMEHKQWVPISAKAWGCLLLLAIVCSAICYVVYGVAIRSVDPLSVSLSININPLAACIGGALLLGESLTGQELLGGVLIMASVVLDTLKTSGRLGKSA